MHAIGQVGMVFRLNDIWQNLVVYILLKFHERSIPWVVGSQMGHG